MAEVGSQRRLAAVLHADVAGYSRLMQHDDRGTLRMLNERRALFQEFVSRHGGRVVNAPGDSILAEFPSVVEAVQCAVELQGALAELDAGASEAERMLFRIGVNLGDVLVDAQGIYGDGVNVAARLEALAQPGGICVSGSVHDQLEGKLDLAFESMGEQSVKNIARPVRVYRIGSGPAAPARARAVDQDARRPFSIVVLPFDNLSDDREQGYLADAIIDDLTTDLSRIAGSFVISRNTAFTYKGKAVDVKQVGRELGVRYVLEGSIRRVGNRVRVNAQLIDTDDGAHVWADRFDRDLVDLLALQDDITGSIARTLRYELIEAEGRRSVREHPDDPRAVDYALRASAALVRDPMLPRGNLLEARRLYEEALRLDPGSVQALTGLAGTWLMEATHGWSEDEAVALEHAEALIVRAQAEAPGDRRVLECQGALLVGRRRPDLAIEHWQAAHARDPNSTDTMMNLGWCHVFLGEPELAVSYIESALRRDPRGYNRANMHGTLGTAKLYLGRYEEAIRDLELCRSAKPTLAFVRFMLAAAYALAGRMDEARAVLQEFRRMRPGVGIARLRSEALSTLPRYLELRERVYEGLRLAGLEE